MTIETIALHFCYGEVEVLKGVNFRAEKGEVTVLMGRNGAGKTTLLKHLNGLLRPRSGKVLIDGKEIKYDRKSLLEVRKKVFYIFQNPDDQILSPTVWQDVAFGPRNLGLNGERLETVVREALKAVGLVGYEKRLCSTLSGGEKRRLAIASALAMSPDYYIMDEPSANVDGEGLNMIVEIIEKLREEKKGIVVSTHDADLAKEVGDKFYFMDDGKIVWEGEEFSYRIARKLGIRSFSVGEVILADKPVDGSICFPATEFEKAVLKAFEGETVVILGGDDWLVKELEKFPVRVTKV